MRELITIEKSKLRELLKEVYLLCRVYSHHNELCDAIEEVDNFRIEQENFVKRNLKKLEVK